MTQTDSHGSEPDSLQPDQPPKAPGLLRSSAIVGIMTMLSRVLGLVRDIVLAAFVGANANADAFFIAFKIPQFMRRLFAEGAFSQAFVPVLSEYRQQRSFADVKIFVDRVAGLLGCSVFFVTALAMIGAPVLTLVFAPGFAGQTEKYALTSDLIRITFPYLFFISMTGFAGAVLNAYGRFAVPAFTPVLLNLSLILSAAFGVQYFEQPVFALAWGVFIAGAVQMLFQLPFLMQLRLLPKPKINTQDEGVKRVLWLMVPALFGVSVSQINLLLDTVLASFLPTGSISWLYYSDRLAELPLGVFGIAIATVILPSLSRKHVDASGQDFAKTLLWAKRLVLLISLPSTAALIVLAQPILFTLFQRGAMTPADVVMSSYSMSAYALGLTAFMMIKILAPGYYARQDTKTPVKIGIIAMVSNMLLNVAFVWPLYTYWNLGHVGLAAATSTSAYLNAYLLYRGLKKQGIVQLDKAFWLMSLRYVLALSVMVGLLLSFNPDHGYWLAANWYERASSLAGLCVMGLLAYLACLALLGARLRDFRAAA